MAIFNPSNIPIHITHQAHAVAIRSQIVKNRSGRSSKLQGILGRLIQHLEEDQVMVIMTSEELRMLSEPSKPKSPLIWQNTNGKIKYSTTTSSTF